MRCPNCSTELPPNVSRCPQCGELVSLLSDWWPSYKEQASKEKPQRDEGVGERLNREKGANDVTAREQAAKDRLAREQAAREQAARERAVREQAAREQAAKEEAARQQAAKDRAAREQAAKDRLAREQTSREQAIKDRLMREQAAWDQGPVQPADKAKQPETKAEPTDKIIEAPAKSGETKLEYFDKDKSVQSQEKAPDKPSSTHDMNKTKVSEEKSMEKTGGKETKPELKANEVKTAPSNEGAKPAAGDTYKPFNPGAKSEPVKQVKTEPEKKADLIGNKASSPDSNAAKPSGAKDDKPAKKEAAAAQNQEKAPKSLMATNVLKKDFSLNSPIILAIVAVVGVILLIVGFKMLFNRPKADMSYPVSPWPMYRYDARHTGLSPFTGPKKPKLAWNYQLESAFKTDPLIAVDGRLYVVSQQKGQQAQYKLYLVKTDGKLEGEIRLQKGAGGADPELNADIQGIALSENYSRDNSTMYAVLSNNKVVIAKADGTVVKTCQAAGHILYSPILGPADVIYIVSQPSKHHIALEAISPFGIKMWAYQVEAAGTIVFTPPAIDGDGTAYVGGSNGNVYAINFDGSEKWTFQADAEIDAAPAVGRDGTLYVSSKNKLYAIDPETGSEQWSVDLPNAGAQAIGVDSTIYVATMATLGGGKLYAFTPDGTKKWEWQTPDNLCTAPVISGDSTIYVGSESGKVYAINKDGKKQWELQVAQMPIVSSPIIGVGNTLYVWSGDSIYSIQEAN